MDVGLALVAVAFIVSAAYVYAPIARVHAARRLRVPVPAGVVTPTAAALAVPPVELPAGIGKLCDRESEPWAREYLRERARAFYAEHGDWNVVAAELERV